MQMVGLPSFSWLNTILPLAPPRCSVTGGGLVVQGGSSVLAEDTFLENKAAVISHQPTYAQQLGMTVWPLMIWPGPTSVQCKGYNERFNY